MMAKSGSARSLPFIQLSRPVVALKFRRLIIPFPMTSTCPGVPMPSCVTPSAWRPPAPCAARRPPRSMSRGHRARPCGRPRWCPALKGCRARGPRCDSGAQPCQPAGSGGRPCRSGWLPRLSPASSAGTSWTLLTAWPSGAVRLWSRKEGCVQDELPFFKTQTDAIAQLFSWDWEVAESVCQISSDELPLVKIHLLLRHPAFPVCQGL